jgi:hypothetical protein
MSLTGKGIYRESFNRWFLELEGIGPVELRYNVHQSRRYREHVEKVRQRLLAKAAKEKANLPKIEPNQNPGESVFVPGVLKSQEEMMAEVLEALIENRLVNGPDDSLEILHIAMNPNPKEEVFSRDKINELLDLDLQSKITMIWADKKVMNPAFCKVLDPHLAPLERQETKIEEGPTKEA